MICTRCGGATPTSPCAACGEEPLLDGRYRLVEVLARRAQGATFRAERVADGVGVVVKELKVQAHHADKRRQLFEREARVLRQLDHPAVPRYLDELVVPAGRWRVLCLVQEHIDGASLADESARRRYDPHEVADVLEELLGVLADLHALSPPVVHRDIKPANVIRRPDGSLALVDFGSVRDALVDPQLGGSTVAGTFGYMAPEQLAGDASPQSDLYAAAATAVALLTRQEPHALIDRTQRWRWERHADVHPALATVLRRMLAANPEQRPASARHALAELAEARQNMAADPAGPPPSPVSEWPAVRAAPVLMGAALLLAIPVLVAVMDPFGTPLIARKVLSDPPGVRVDTYVVEAREQVLYTSGSWLGECLDGVPVALGSNELQTVLPVRADGSVASAWFRLEHGDDDARACMQERLLGLRFGPPPTDGAEVWFSWSWEGLTAGDAEPTYNERARTSVEAVEPALEACVRRHVPDADGLNFVQVFLTLDDGGGVARKQVRAVYETDAMRACLDDQLDVLRFDPPGDDPAEVWFRFVVRPP